MSASILAGWPMGLLSWLVAAGRDTISQIVIVWMIASAIGLCGLHHAVLGSTKFWRACLLRCNLTVADYAHFFFWTTLGNGIGGPLFVALLKTHPRQLTASPAHQAGRNTMPQSSSMLARHTPAVKEVHIVWLDRGAGLRWRFRLHHGRHAAQHRRRRAGKLFQGCPRCICTIRSWPTRWAKSS